MMQTQLHATTTETGDRKTKVVVDDYGDFATLRISVDNEGEVLLYLDNIHTITVFARAILDAVAVSLREDEK